MPSPCARGLRRARSCLTKYGGFFDGDNKTRRLAQIDGELAAPDIWQQPEKTRTLQKERAALAKGITEARRLQKRITECGEMLQLADDENDAAMIGELAVESRAIAEEVQRAGLRRFFTGSDDESDCFLAVQAGSGGTEAQDWAAMLFRMYARYAESAFDSARMMEESPGEVAGIKTATLKVIGTHAYGKLSGETGIHRLVRKSPFDANHRRHTSFASVFVFPVTDDSIQITINPADLRVDTFRASGAGGQHVNTTDSAVRIAHLPSGIVVQCQSDRSQHKNRAEAMSMLRARLREHELRLREAEKEKVEAGKDDISWGRQIRSYVLDQSRIKDLRNGYESGNPRAILDGDLEGFIRANLLHRAKSAGN